MTASPNILRRSARLLAVALCAAPLALLADSVQLRLRGFGAGAAAGISENAVHRLAEGEAMRIEAVVTVDEMVEAVTFQWFKDGRPFPELWESDAPWGSRCEPGGMHFEWESTRKFPEVRLEDAGRYSVTATVRFAPPRPAALSHTGTITLEVVPGPKITAEPVAPLLSQPVRLSLSIDGVSSLKEVRWSGPQDGTRDWKGAVVNLPGVTFQDAGDYRATVLHPVVGREVRSARCHLRVYPLIGAPVVITQPRNQWGVLGGRAVFAVGAIGGLPVSYQWQKGSLDIPGATNFFLAIENLRAADAGTYRVRVGNTTGSAISEVATLTLPAIANPSPLAESLVLGGRASLTRHTKADLAAAVRAFETAVHSAPEHAPANLLLGIGRLLNLAHQPAANQFLDRLQVLPESRDLYGWSAEPLQDQEGLLAAPGVNASEFAEFFHAQVLPEVHAALTNLARVGPAEFALPLTRAETTIAPVTLDSGDVHLLSAGLLVFEYLARTARSYNTSMPLEAVEAFWEDPRTTIEAILRDYPDLLTFDNATQAALAKGALENAVDNYVQGAGLIRSRPAGVQRLFNLDGDLGAAEERFRQTLLDLKASLQQAVVLSEGAEWRIHLGPLLDGSRSPRSVLPRFVGSVPDAAALPEPAFAGALASVGKATIVLRAMDRMAPAGAKVELAILAMGEAPLSFQWYKGTQALPGATSPKYVIPSLTAADAGSYKVVVSNWQGADTNSVKVTLGVQPSVSLLQPESQTTAAGRPLALEVTAAGSEPLTYQWYRNGTPVPGATFPRLYLGDSRPHDVGTYVVRVSNPAGSVWSRPVEVRLQPAPAAFAAPMLTEVFSEETPVQGPSRTVHDGRGAIYAYGERMDIVEGIQRGGLMKLSESDLSVDPWFGVDPALPEVHAVAVQPDGKLLIAGVRHDACMIVRVDPSGQEDPSFQAPAFNRGIRFITLQPDGRILLTATEDVLGNPTALAVPNPTIIRLHANGQLDGTFTAPLVVADGSGPRLLAPPVVDPAGRIYIGGSFTNINGVSRLNFARLLPDGSLDAAYLGTAGLAGGVASSEVRGIGIQSDSRVVIVGDFRIPATASASDSLGALRFRPDGTHDATFARVKLSEMGMWFPNTLPRAMIVLPDDRLLLAANTLVRLDRDGTLDRSFPRPSFRREAHWVSRAPDGGIYVPGVMSVNYRAAGGIAVFDENGNWMESVDPGGFGRADYPTSFALLPEDRVVMAGRFNQAGSRARPNVVILEADGRAALRQFEPQEHLGGLAAPSQFAAVTSGGSGAFYVLLKDRWNRAALQRVRPDGTADPAFKADDRLALASATDIIGQPDGGLLVPGGGNAQAALLKRPLQRLRADGSLDLTFVGPSSALMDSMVKVTRGADQTIQRVDVGGLKVLSRDAAGRFLVALNSSNGEAGLLRLTAPGTEDPSFTPGVVDRRSGSDTWREDVTDLVTGKYASVVTVAYAERVISSAVELPDGRILVGGRFHRYAGSPAPCLVRLHPDGTVDASFRPGSGPRLPEDPVGLPSVNGLAAGEAGETYVSGVFTELNGVAVPGLARLLQDGSVDSSFRPPIRFVDYGQAEARLHFEDGRLFAVGTFAGSDEAFPRAFWRLDLHGAVSITQNPPANVVAAAGGSVTLEVAVSGEGPFSYQWRRDGLDLPGANSARLVLEAMTFADSGRYTVEVRNTMGVARSTVTDLRVVPALTAEAIGFTGNGAPRLSLAVIPGVRLVVEASTDLVQWDLIADTTPATSVLFVTDQAGRGSDHRFYRVRFPDQ